MKAIKKSSRIREFAIAAAACLAFILSTVFSFVFGARTVVAAASDTEPDLTNESAIAFVQVAAGKDFAIGLTYDGDLYGWSLLDPKASGYDATKIGVENRATSLGEYYPQYPTLITPKFVEGPYNTAGDADSDKSTAYHNPSSDQYIVQIATTSTTAAFITNHGLIYTWGVDTPKDISGGKAYSDTLSSPHYLLLRPTDREPYSWCEPYIIQYYKSKTSEGGITQYLGYGGTSTTSGSSALPKLRRNTPGYSTAISIAGGENNYIFVQDGTVFVWGSLLYANTQMPTSQFTSISFGNKDAGKDINVNIMSDNDQGGMYRSLYECGDSAAVAVAGGYTVGLNKSSSGGSNKTSLALRGKNFVSSAPVSVDEGTKKITIVPTVMSDSTNKIAFTDEEVVSEPNYYFAENAIIGNVYNSTRTLDTKPGYVVDHTATGYYGMQNYQASGSISLAYTATKQDAGSSGIYNAYNAYAGNERKKATDPAYASIIRNAVSLGNDIGYGISSGDNKLYAWGDNTYGQNGLGATDVATTKVRSYPEQSLTSLSGKFISTVAAGKQLSPDAAHKIFNADKTKSDKTDSGNFASDYQNEADYITGVVTTTGELWAWGNKIQDPTQIKYGGIDANKFNEFVAVYSGYGNNLFAVTALGKVVRITQKNNGTESTPVWQFDCKVYDKFGSAINQSKPDKIDVIENWKTVDANNPDNSISFTVNLTGSSKDDPAELGTINLFVDHVYTENGTVLFNGKSADAKIEPPAGEKAYKSLYYNGARGSLVTENKIGDAYRILNYKDDATINYLSASALTRYDLMPKFYFTPQGGAMESKPMNYVDGTDSDVDATYPRIDNMFDWDMLYDKDYGVGLTITPKQSTKCGTVTVKFYVARYDNRYNYESNITGNSAPTGTYSVYYDYKEVSVQFTVDNTKAYKNFSPYDEKGYCNIPVLDPNNSANRSYSVAVQDISTGVEELVNFLTEDVENSTLQTSRRNALNGYILEAMKKADSAGFPASSKIADGNLKYTLGSSDTDDPYYLGTGRKGAEDFYTDRYQYLFKDRDADLIKIGEIETAIVGKAIDGSITATSGDRCKVTITLENFAGNDNLSKYQIKGSVIDSLYNNFNNVYGIFDIDYSVSNTYLSSLTFSYYVVTFTASATSGSLTYDGTTPKVNAWNTKYTGNDAIRFNINHYYEYIRYSTATKKKADVSGYTSDYKATDRKYVIDGTDWKNTSAIHAYSQASLRLLDAYKTNNKVVYGDATAKNNHYDKLDDTPLAVGDTRTIRLDTYVGYTGPYISFSFNNQKSYADFEKQFPDPLGGENCVKLTENTITVRPTTSHNIYFTVTIQRFVADSNNVRTFAGDNEKVTISFAFTNITGVSLEASSEKAEDYEFSIAKTGKVYVLGGGSAEDAINKDALINLTKLTDKYKPSLKMSTPTSTDNSILSVAKVEDSETEMTITPKASGIAYVQFVMSAYDKSIPLTLKFNVSGVTTIKDNKGDYTVSLSNTEYIYVSTLITSLKNSVSFNSDVQSNKYTILYDDKTGEYPNTNYAAVYFKKWDKSTKTESDMAENKYLPDYIKSIRFLETDDVNTAYIMLELDEDASEMSDMYRMHVRFVNKDNGFTKYEEAEAAGASILETTLLIESSKKIAIDADQGSMLVIRADVDKPQRQNEINPTSSWYMVGQNIDAKIYVPLQYLLNLLNDETIVPNEYEIFLVSAPDGTAQYFNYTFIDKDIIITPNYNTPVTKKLVGEEEIEVDFVTVSVSARSSNSSKANQVISFGISVKGISTVLTKSEYKTIWIVAFFSSFGLLFVIFIIRMIIYWRRRAKQRALIKRNQELIKMRDRIHNRTATATRTQVIRTKLKMEDPRYAKMFNEMKREKGGEPAGVMVEGSDFASTAAGDQGDKKGKKKKKKGGKKSMAELKAELAAKKAAFAQAQSGAADPGMYGGSQPVGDFGAAPMDGGFAPDAGGFGGDPGFGSPADAFSASDLDGNAIIFDTPDMDDGSQG